MAKLEDPYCYETEIVPLNDQSIEAVAATLMSQLSPFPEWAKRYVSNQKPIVNFFTSQVSKSGPDGTVEVNEQVLILFKVSTSRPELAQFDGCIQLRYSIPAVDPIFVSRHPDSEPE